MKLIPFLRGMRSFTSPSKISTSSLQQCFLHADSVGKDSQSNPMNLDPFGPRPPPSDKILELADRIAALPIEELKQIGPALQSLLMYPKLQQISSGGFNLGPQTGATAAKPEEKKAEKTAFDVKLEKFDAAAKIKVIKEVRSFTSLGLKEAKDLVEKAPIVLKQGVTKEEANDIIAKIKAVGGVAVME